MSSILPGFTIQQKTYRHRRNTKYFSYFRLAQISLLLHLKDFLYVILCKFCEIMILTFMGIQSIFPSMRLILLRRTPFKILRPIVSDIMILMVHFRKIFMISNKRDGDESVYKKFSWSAFFVKHDHFVAVSYEPWFKKSTLFPPTRTSVNPNLSAFVSKIQTLVPFYFFHYQMIP